MNFAGFSQFFVILCFPFGFLCSNIYVPLNGIPDSDTNLPKLEGRIVNGTKATMGQFPHQVSLRRSYSNAHFCGGSIIDTQWVLTAAHCMFDSNGKQIFPWSISVTAGHIRLNQTDSNVQKHAVRAIIVHKNFQPSNLTNDVALLKMTTPFNLNTTFVKAAKLETKMPAPGTRCKVSGWGYLAENIKVVSNNLMFVDLPLVNRTECKKLLANVTNLPSGMFCAGYKEGLQDACQGDSGGGMICGNTLTGVVSGGLGCARPKLPGFYADVPYYRNWVTNQIKTYNETTGSSTTQRPSTTTKKNKKNSSTNVETSFFFYASFATLLMTNFFGIATFNE